MQIGSLYERAWHSESQMHQARGVRRASSDPSTFPNQHRSSILVFIQSLGPFGSPKVDISDTMGWDDEVQVESEIVH